MPEKKSLGPQGLTGFNDFIHLDSFDVEIMVRYFNCRAMPRQKQVNGGFGWFMVNWILHPYDLFLILSV